MRMLDAWVARAFFFFCFFSLHNPLGRFSSSQECEGGGVGGVQECQPLSKIYDLSPIAQGGCTFGRLKLRTVYKPLFFPKQVPHGYCFVFHFHSILLFEAEWWKSVGLACSRTCNDFSKTKSALILQFLLFFYPLLRSFL